MTVTSETLDKILNNKSLENAKQYVNNAMGDTVASRKVVWP